ncbi:MAG TPA: Hpt domain-containing protein [Aestuariivirgaceae bacterium]|jgi:HPt (histidine-containing phosphotransfer) domain-containing protein|nr:Hpt domain-containing protein [Aestuariivirgaceae bacterium]
MFGSASHGCGEPAGNHSECDQDATQEEIFDLAHLRRYTDNDLELECELLTLFRLQIRQYAERLALIADPEEWRIATHSIKGAARSMGAHRISGVAEMLEVSGPCGDTAEGRAMIADLIRDLEACEAAIARLAPARRG